MKGLFDRPTGTFPLGLERDGNRLRGALLNYNNGKPIIERVFELPVPEGHTHQSPLILLQPPLSRDRLRRALIVTGLAADESLVRPMDLKLTKIKDIDAVLAFQAEPLLPYAVDNAVIDRWILSSSNEETQLSLLSVRKDHLQQHLAFYQGLEIEPEVTTCYPAALATFAAHYAVLNEAAFVIHIGRELLTCVLVENGKALAAYAIPGATKSLFQSDAATQKTTIEALRQTISRTIFALTKLAKGRDVASVLVTGEGATIGSIPTDLAQTLNKTLAPVNVPEGSSASPGELLTYAIPIGLAYSALPLNGDQINFRRDEFAYPNPWRRLKKPLAIYISGCLLAAFLIARMGQAVIGHQEDRIHQEYAQLLQIMGKSHRSFELELQGKEPTPELLTHEAEVPLGKLSAQELEIRLNGLQKQIESTPDIFPLQPDIPTVSHVLAWISTHTKAVKVDPKTGKREPLISIESLNYAMTKRPDKTKPRERYQAKVDLEFTSPDPKSAREFYDALLEPNDIVDPKGEVSWSAGQGRYRTSFYLKDRTAYP